ncbi:hypothetical protein [Sphingopyxis sp. KK2]|uniref:hypothetical protein n=1 Tax=Sphingopyxis sp. KK2 TaxID=1855727 RepID=UPI0011817DC3|nr:hypothetical protein [Sphingopyxis sp. KK2]
MNKVKKARPVPLRSWVKGVAWVTALCGPAILYIVFALSKNAIFSQCEAAGGGKMRFVTCLFKLLAGNREDYLIFAGTILTMFWWVAILVALRVYAYFSDRTKQINRRETQRIRRAIIGAEKLEKNANLEN